MLRHAQHEGNFAASPQIALLILSVSKDEASWFDGLTMRHYVVLVLSKDEARMTNIVSMETGHAAER